MDFRKPKTLVFSLLLAAIAVLFVIVMFAVVSDNGLVGTWGVNKTVGWAFEFADMASVFSILSVLLFISGYIFLWIIRVHLNRIVSIVNFFLILALPIVWILEHINYKYLLTFLTASGVVVVLIINTIFAIVYKLNDKERIS